MNPDRPRWHCPRCQALNYSGAQACDACGTANEGDGAGSPNLPKMVIENPLMFFPEAALAALIVLIAPVWLLVLLARGRIGAAAVLVVGVGGSVTGIVHALRANQKFFVYGCMLALLGTAALANDTAG